MRIYNVLILQVMVLHGSPGAVIASHRATKRSLRDPRRPDLHRHVSQSCDAWTQVGRDLNGDAADDQFGRAVALSADGSVLAVGIVGVDSPLPGSGRVQVFQWNNGEWAQMGHNIDGKEGDYAGFRRTVALSANGMILAMGAGQNDVNGVSSGQVRVFEYTESTGWVQLGNDLNGQASADQFGYSISLSASGTLLAVGANNAGFGGVVQFFQRTSATSNWTQIGGDLDGKEQNQSNFGRSVSLSASGTVIAVGGGYGQGCVSVFQFKEQKGFSKVGREICSEEDENFGESIALSSHGTVLAVGADKTDINGDHNGGNVKVYELVAGAGWIQKGQNIGGERAGNSVAISGDGAQLAIGGPFKDWTGEDSGHVRIFAYESQEGSWTQMGDDIDGIVAGAGFGFSVAFSADGSTVAAGGPDYLDGTTAGHVRVFRIDPSCIPFSPGTVSLSATSPAVSATAELNTFNGITIDFGGAEMLSQGEIQRFESLTMVWYEQFFGGQSGQVLDMETNITLFGQSILRLDEENHSSTLVNQITYNQTIQYTALDEVSLAADEYITLPFRNRIANKNYGMTLANSIAAFRNVKLPIPVPRLAENEADDIGTFLESSVSRATENLSVGAGLGIGVAAVALAVVGLFVWKSRRSPNKLS